MSRSVSSTIPVPENPHSWRGLFFLILRRWWVSSECNRSIRPGLLQISDNVGDQPSVVDVNSWRGLDRRESYNREGWNASGFASE